MFEAWYNITPVKKLEYAIVSQKGLLDCELPLYPWSVSLRSMTVMGLKLRSHSRMQPSLPPVAKPSSHAFMLKIPDCKIMTNRCRLWVLTEQQLHFHTKYLNCSTALEMKNDYTITLQHFILYDGVLLRVLAWRITNYIIYKHHKMAQRMEMRGLISDAIFKVLFSFLILYWKGCILNVCFTFVMPYYTVMEIAVFVSAARATLISVHQKTIHYYASVTIKWTAMPLKEVFAILHSKESICEQMSCKTVYMCVLILDVTLWNSLRDERQHLSAPDPLGAGRANLYDSSTRTPGDNYSPRETFLITSFSLSLLSLLL